MEPQEPARDDRDGVLEISDPAERREVRVDVVRESLVAYSR